MISLPIIIIVAIIVIALSSLYFILGRKSSTTHETKPQLVPASKDVISQRAEEHLQQLQASIVNLQVELKDGKGWSPIKITSMASSKQIIATIQEDEHVVRLYRIDQVSNAISQKKSIVKHNTIIDLGGQEFPNAVAISPNGDLVAVSLDFANKLRLFNISYPATQSKDSFSPLKVFKSWKNDSQPHYKPVSQIEFTPNGKIIVTSTRDEDRLYLWDSATGNLLLRYNLGQLQTNMFSISPTGKYIAAATFTSSLKVYEVVTGNEEGAAASATLKKYADLNVFKLSLYSVSFKEDNLMVATSKDGTLKIVDTRPLDLVANIRAKEADSILFEKKLISEDPTQITKAQYSPFENLLVTVAGKSVQFYKTKNSLEKSAYKKNGMEYIGEFNHPCVITRLLFLDEKKFITAGADGIARVYTIDNY